MIFFCQVAWHSTTRLARVVRPGGGYVQDSRNRFVFCHQKIFATFVYNVVYLKFKYLFFNIN